MGDTATATRSRGANGKRYLEVENHLRRAINSGKYAPGERLPDERQLAVMLGVSRGTVRVALERLASVRKIERHQGRGTFVSRPDTEPSYLCAVAVGPTARQTMDVGTTIAQAELAAQRRGLRLAVRYAVDPEELAQVISQVGSSQMNAGGLVLGHTTSDALNPSVAASRIPWVMVGEFTEERRAAPMVDQVLPDWYTVIEAGTRRALERGSRSLALAVFGQQWVYSADCMSAFRTECEAAGIPRSAQDVVDLHAYRKQTPASPEQYHGFVVRAVLAALDRWISGERFPDHLIMPATTLATWFECLHARPAAAQLRKTPITAWAIEEQKPMLTPSIAPAPITWLLIPVLPQLEQALHRLFERREQDRTPTRDYVRAFRIEDSPPTEIG